MSKTYAYCRVSTVAQVDKGESLETQQRVLTGQAMVMGRELDCLFIEEGVSGSVPLVDRPEGKEMLSRLQKGDVVIATKLDRMFRSALDALSTLEEFKAMGVSLYLMDLGGDVVSNGMSRMVFTILAAVAEAERGRLRERIVEVMSDMRARGLWVGGKHFGYKCEVRDGVRYKVEDPEGQAKIKEMLRLYGEKPNYNYVAKKMGLYPMSVKRVIDRQLAQTL